MKKIYSLITVMLMGFACTMQAQHKWTATGGNLAEGALVAGEDHFYALQAGDNTQADGTPGKHAKTAFLSGNEHLSKEITNETVWNFIDTGKEKEGFKVYVLKNVSNGQYVAQYTFDKPRYTTNIEEAFEFTARKAVASNEDEIEQEQNWLVYSCAVSNTRSVKAEELGTWVLCNPNEKRFLSYVGNPAFFHYIDTNNWYIYPVGEKEVDASDRFSTVYNQYFAYGVDESTYRVGTDPGCINQETLDKMKELYKVATQALNDKTTPLEEYNRLLIEVINLFEVELPQSIVPMSAGFYVLKNVGERGFLTLSEDKTRTSGQSGLCENNVKEGTDYKNWTPESVTAWDANNVSYIWEVEGTEETGMYYLKNIQSGQYLAANADLLMQDTPAGTFAVNNFMGTEFCMQTQDGLAHMSIQDGNKLIIYNDMTDHGSRFQFYKISHEVVDALSEYCNVAGLRSQMEYLVNQTKVDLQYANFVEDGFYKNPADCGLVTKVLEANSWSTQEGSLDALFDNNFETYFHTSWSEGDVSAQQTTGKHWIKVDLGKEVQELVVKFSKRHTANNHIRKYALYTTSDSTGRDNNWDKLVATSADTIEYAYQNGTHIASYKLEVPARYIRFEVLNTIGSQEDTNDQMIAETGPLWHMSEFRLYDQSDLAPDPRYASVPEDVKNLLRNAYQAAVDELATDKVSQSTYNNLKNAKATFLGACNVSTNGITAEDVTASAGSQVVLPINMENSANICGFQFDLYLPQGVTMAQDADGFDLVEVAKDRTNARKHTIMSAIQKDGSTRVLCYSNRNEVFEGNSGKVANLTLNIASDIKSGAHEVVIRNIVMTTPSLNRYTPNESKSSIVVKSFTMGDVNNDAHIDVTDVAGVVNYILGSVNDNLVKDAADINQDNNIDVTDVAGVVSLILSGDKQPTSLASYTVSKAAEETQNISLEILPFTLEANEEKKVAVLMNNPGDAFTGLQFDLYLPEDVELMADQDGFYYVDLGSRTSGRRHTVESAKQKDGAIRILAYSGKNLDFNGEEGDVLVLTFRGGKNLNNKTSEISIKNIVLARKDVTNNKPANCTLSVLAGQPAEKDIVLKGHFTPEAMKEFSAAMNTNAQVTSVDFSQAVVDPAATLTTGNPNALVYVAEGMKLANPANVVVKDVCEKLVLTDGHPFSAKQAFNANSASFSRNTNADAWYSICLPFAANLPANAVVEQFVDVDAQKGIVSFEDATAMKANMPYVFKAAMSGETAFEAENVEVPATQKPAEGLFVGTLNEVGNDVANKFVLKADGSAFESCASVPAFCAYLTAKNAQSLKVYHGKLSGIENVAAEEALFPADVYTLDGKLVKKQANNLNGLGNGVYIVNGKKIVK